MITSAAFLGETAIFAHEQPGLWWQFLQREATGHGPLPFAARARVLLADPDERLLAIYRAFLTTEFNLRTATGGVECLARLREEVPDVLVLEPELPWGGGDGVLAVMAEMPHLASVRVMILTSCRDPALLHRVAPYRISDYCAKPVTARQLAVRIRHVASRGRVTAQPVSRMYVTTSGE